MAKKPKEDWYWPLGALGYAEEISDSFPTETELIGVITILWNRHEIALRRIFISLMRTRSTAYAEAIWERQPTHQSRRDLLSLALGTVKLTKRQKAILEWIIDRTKTMADRRNELIHAEYVVHGRTDALHAKVKPPRSNKPPKHQRVMESDLRKVANGLSHLVAATEAADIELMSRRKRARFDELGQQLDELAQSRKNQRTD
ncbi:hypothetical protein [Parasphingopyxis sp.]|uniref:hypothetical protein n=1 Tax=Parasphingopyxis sp. TaxID=1920299 RepID=UPI0026291B4F|nr:hypothetical protein [Parasphingopyxis sp.]